MQPTVNPEQVLIQDQSQARRLNAQYLMKIGKHVGNDF